MHLRRLSVVALAFGAASVGLVPLSAQEAGAAPLPDVACRYITAISAGNPVAGPAAIDTVAVPGSDAAAYATFERDLLAASAAAEQNVTRTVRCTPTTVEVDLLQYGIPIKPPKKVTAVYDSFAVDGSGRVMTFAVNGTPITGQVVVGTGVPVTALGTAVTMSSAYRVPRGGGESVKAKNAVLVAVRATAPTDGLRDLVTGAATYQLGKKEDLAARTVGPGSPLLPGASAVWVLQFDSKSLGGTLTVPVVSKPSALAGPNTPLEPAVLTVHQPGAP
ncbi:MAG: hypothetical protein WDA60_06320 [Acidimicrobiia bacterium]|jgi:hypothetical protein